MIPKRKTTLVNLRDMIICIKAIKEPKVIKESNLGR